MYSIDFNNLMKQNKTEIPFIINCILYFVQQIISELLQTDHSYENEFYLHVTENSFSYERLYTRPHPDKEARDILAVTRLLHYTCTYI